jgi:3-oxoacyl-[acyl-carrier protein] reductase
MNKSEARRRTIVIGANSGIAGGMDEMLGAQGHELWLTYASEAARPSERPAPANAHGIFLMIEKLLPLLRAGAGDHSVVNGSSAAGGIGGVSASGHYVASKAAILAITQSFARLLAAGGHSHRRRRNRDGSRASWLNQLSADRRDRLAATVPVRRWGVPEDVAVELLASESGRFITGATNDVNWGLRIDG